MFHNMFAAFVKKLCKVCVRYVLTGSLRLQTWAIFLPQFGVYYRPWLRRVTFILFLLISVFSLATGFYDLYKHTPYVDQASHCCRVVDEAP